jgi:hypothetical protein
LIFEVLVSPSLTVFDYVFSTVEVLLTIRSERMTAYVELEWRKLSTAISRYNVAFARKGHVGSRNTAGKMKDAPAKVEAMCCYLQVTCFVSEANFLGLTTL